MLRVCCRYDGIYLVAYMMYVYPHRRHNELIVVVEPNMPIPLPATQSKSSKSLTSEMRKNMHIRMFARSPGDCGSCCWLCLVFAAYFAIVRLSHGVGARLRDFIQIV